MPATVSYHNTPNIIFDLGGVLLPLHLDRTYKAFDALGLKGFEHYFDSYSGASFIEAYEIGQTSSGEFLATLSALCRSGTKTADIERAWNAMLGDFLPERIRLLQQLGTRYRLFLFSNTNALHHDLFQERFVHTTGLPSFDQLFEKAYFSHQLGYRKPHANGFLHILQAHGLQPAETVFIDDGQKHIATARELGLSTILISENQQVEDIVFE